jgi:hypothetical protein
MTLLQLSIAVEAALVARNPRQMARLRAALEPGYYLRAARLFTTPGRVLIATGFPVAGSFETDGPLGAIALYQALAALGHECHIACADPLAGVLGEDFSVLRLEAFDHASAEREAAAQLAALQPDRIISIERPGLAADGRYYNMRGIDISGNCAIFDYHMRQASCPTVAIGDGGNEIGMGNVADAVASLEIRGATTTCDELLVADVSNWGAYGLIALLDRLSGKPLLGAIDHDALLRYLSDRGSVDGVTGENTLSEDGLPASAGAEILETLAALLRESPADAGQHQENQLS